MGVNLLFTAEMPNIERIADIIIRVHKYEVIIMTFYYDAFSFVSLTSFILYLH